MVGESISRGALSTHLRGHLLQFEKPPSVTHDAVAGTRLLIAAIGLEIVRVAALNWLRPVAPFWLLLTSPLLLALVAIPTFVRLKWSDIGFRPWRKWTRTEKSYFVQVVLLANVVFGLLFSEPLRERIAERGTATVMLGVFLPYLAFGFYQELVYRGMLQLELVRRWGALAGIFVANICFTFGPLHWNHLSAPMEKSAPMLAAIFVVGLFFGVLFLRSGNLWLAAIFHAVGNAYIAASSRA